MLAEKLVCARLLGISSTSPSPYKWLGELGDESEKREGGDRMLRNSLLASLYSCHSLDGGSESQREPAIQLLTIRGMVVWLGELRLPVPGDWF